jgi:hypothetical protein
MLHKRGFVKKNSWMKESDGERDRVRRGIEVTQTSDGVTQENVDGNGVRDSSDLDVPRARDSRDKASHTAVRGRDRGTENNAVFAITLRGATVLHQPRSAF